MPEASRRAVLAAAGVGAVTAVVGTSGAAAAATRSAVPARAAWTGVRGSRVVLRGASGAGVKALVREIADLSGAVAGDELRYSVFLEPVRHLVDGTYRIVGTGFAGSALSFINIGPAGTTLQAVVDARPR